MEIIEYLWACGAVADSNLIISVDDVITIYVTILNVTGLNGRECLSWACCDVGLRSEETDSLKTVDLTHTVASLNEVVVHARFLKLFLDLALGQHEITADVELHLTEGLVVVETELQTMAVNLSCILVWCVHTKDIRILTSC